MSLPATDRPILPRPHWIEAVGFVVWFVALGGWIAWTWRGDQPFGLMHLALAMGLLLAIGILARDAWARLFGPVLLYEALRTSRRTRFFLLRWLYAIGLLLLLLWVHWIWNLGQRYSDPPLDSYKQQAKLAEQFFYAFAIIQFAVVVLLTPAYVAGGIAEEKERRTLDFLLATDLNGREIIFGKLLARLGNLGLFVLTGLPVLSLMQFFGGIDPGLLLASFAVTAMTALSLAGLGILLSVQRRRARDAIILTYLIAVGYAAIASASWLLPIAVAQYRRETGQTANVLDEWLADGVSWFNYGNPFSALWHVVHTLESNRPVPEVVSEVVQDYSAFHGIFFIICVTWAVLRLRPIALAQAGSTPKKHRFRLLPQRRRPPVGARPMLWKEVRIEGGLKFGWFGRIVVGVVVGLTFVPVVLLVAKHFDPATWQRGNLWKRFSEDINIWLRVVNVIISTLMLLGVAVRAAGSVGGERDRDTLTSLMTTPLNTSEIFWAKCAGSLWSVRMFVWWLGAVWLIGLVTGSVGVFAPAMQVVFWIPPAAFVAALGLYLSSICKTTLRATTWTIFWALFAMGGHWVCVGMCCFMPARTIGASGTHLEWAVLFEAALTPPFVFGWLPYQSWDQLLLDREKIFPVMTVVGGFIWVIAALATCHLAHERFRKLTNRQVKLGHDPLGGAFAARRTGGDR